MKILSVYCQLQSDKKTIYILTRVVTRRVYCVGTFQNRCVFARPSIRVFFDHFPSRQNGKVCLSPQHFRHRSNFLRLINFKICVFSDFGALRKQILRKMVDDNSTFTFVSFLLFQWFTSSICPKCFILTNKSVPNVRNSPKVILVQILRVKRLWVHSTSRKHVREG